MVSFYVAVGYSIVNPILAILILSKSRRNVLSKLYSFCVFVLCTLGVVSYLLGDAAPNFPVRVFEQISAFLYSLFPFFFLHFMLIFVRRYEILNSRSIIVATYCVGLFSYVMVLLNLIPNPFASGVSPSGYVYYLTWMSILFSVGVAILFSLVGGFAERGMKSNVLFVAFTLLMLLLPTPFTQSIFALFTDNSVALYFTSSIAALAILVFIVFRHRIVMNMPYQAMKAALEAMNDILIKTDLELTVQMAQGGVLSILGYSEKELIGKSIKLIVKETGPLEEFRESVARTKASTMSMEVDVLSKTNERLQMDFSFTPVFANEDIVGFVGVGRNITEKKRLEAQLRQAQKMEILGTLAGGVAHDFNNILTIILANAEVVGRLQADQTKSAPGFDAIRSAVKRGAGMVSQLLTFARKTEVNFQFMDINKVVGDVVTMVSSTFPRSISVSILLAPDLPRIRVDVNQIGQALLNLCVNARDAVMDKGGETQAGSLSISTKIINHAGLHTRFADAEPGTYVEIAVADTGIGMDESTKARIFEPFFSTKQPGKGTGLGLAVVYGVMKSHHGFIDAESSLGRGTTFRLFFPVQVDASLPAETKSVKVQDAQGGGETLLIVDDEEMLLSSLRSTFEGKGYRVHSARDGEEAISVFKKYAGEISLVLMDVDIPKVDGVEAMKRMKVIKPGLKTVFCTGSIDPDSEDGMRAVHPDDVIRKPYSMADLSHQIRVILDSRA